MNQKSLNIVLVLVVVILVGAIGYLFNELKTQQVTTQVEAPFNEKNDNLVTTEQDNQEEESTKPISPTEIERLVIVNEPKPNAIVDASKPIIIKGKAKNVFNEGEFSVTADYMLDDTTGVIVNTYASVDCPNCDPTTGDLMDFKAKFNLSTFKNCNVKINFNARNAWNTHVYTLPLRLEGINCK